MTTTRLDGLLIVAGASAPDLWFAIVDPAEWDRWRLSLELAGGDYVALPFAAAPIPVLATMAPPAGGCLMPRFTASNTMRGCMMLAIEAGWSGNPDLSERWATKLDVAEKLVRDFGPTSWTWPAAPQDRASPKTSTAAAYSSNSSFCVWASSWTVQRLSGTLSLSMPFPLGAGGCPPAPDSPSPKALTPTLAPSQKPLEITEGAKNPGC